MVVVAGLVVVVVVVVEYEFGVAVVARSCVDDKKEDSCLGRTGIHDIDGLGGASASPAPSV